MMVQFIFMTIAFEIMLIVAIIQNRTIKRQEKTNEELLNKKFNEYIGISKVYRRKYKHIIIANAGDNGTLNCTAEKYHNEGYELDREKSTDRMLVFVKREEVEEG